MVALHGWMLARMCPCDLDAFLESAPAIVGACSRLTGSIILPVGERVSQVAIVRDAVGHPQFLTQQGSQAFLQAASMFRPNSLHPDQ